MVEQQMVAVLQEVQVEAIVEQKHNPFASHKRNGAGTAEEQESAGFVMARAGYIASESAMMAIALHVQIIADAALHVMAEENGMNNKR